MTKIKKITTYLQEKFETPGVKKHAKNIGWMFFARLASMVITFISTAYIARHLGPGNYGELSYAISFVGVFSFMASLGVEQILVRDLVRYPEKRNTYLGSAIFLRVLASTFAIVVCIGSALLISQKDVSLWLIFIISLTHLSGSFQLLGSEFQADAQSKYPSIFSFGVIIILNILKIVTILFNQGVIYLALIILLEPILYSLLYIYLRSKYYGNVRNLTINKTICITILKESFPLVFASAFYVIYSRIDQVIIKNMINAESVGLYDAAVRVSEVSYFIPNIILASLFPAIINAKKHSEDLYHKRIKKLFLMLIGISTLLALATTLVSKYLILVIFGAGFLGAIPVLVIYVWSNIGAALNVLTQQILLSENLTKYISVTTFFGMATNVILNMALIPKYGIEGAAFATLISYMIPFLSLVLFKKTRIIITKIFLKN